jgi:hypothetical protein
MHEFVISPPPGILIVAGAIILLSVATMFIKRGSTRRKLTSIGIAIAVAVGLSIYVYRPVSIAVDEDGLTVRGPGGVSLSWADVESATFDTNLRNSPYRPTVRTRGIAVGDYRRGRFLLSNGRPAQVFMAQPDAAVVILTGDLVYLLAPDDVDALAGAIDTFRVYEPESQ